MTTPDPALMALAGSFTPRRVSHLRRAAETAFPILAGAALTYIGQYWLAFAVMVGALVLFAVVGRLWEMAATELIIACREAGL